LTRSVEPSAVGGSIRAPASKSAMQRAIACAALAPGLSTITNPTWCADSLAAMRVATALGADIQRFDDRVLVHGGLGPVTAGRLDDGPMVASCGESGLCMRMFSAIASLSPRGVELHGEGSLARRPVGMVEGPLAELGVACKTAGGFPPVRVHGPLHAGRAAVDGSESSQFLTGLLLALPMAGGDSVLSVANLASRGYIDLTIDVARAFGADISRDAGFTEFRVHGSSPYKATVYDVEGDWSGAAFLLAAGAIAAGGGALDVGGLSLSSSQPDRAIIDALRLAGASLERIEGGWRVRQAPLEGFSFDATDCPDLFPPLVALASRCTGVTQLRGASRLRAKESDRAAALAGEFGRLGLRVDVDGDMMAVHGFGRGAKLAAGTVSSHGDHRIAMAAAVAALAGAGTVVIEGAESVAKSYPDFYDALDSIRIDPVKPGW
jgi:3-phosphoshikimate 1-carboxyvinyltransferase